MSKNWANKLYVHIPFCSNICAYCDFAKIIYHKKYIDDYLDSLIKELKQLNLKNLETIYVGGGTPTSLSANELEKLLILLTPLLKNDYEFTIECNVENISEEKLALFLKYGVNRLSIGIQSFDDRLLKQINRKHTSKEAIESINMIKKMGFKNINIDLIYGFVADEDMSIWKNDIRKAIELDVDHISCYSLTVTEGTLMHYQKIKEIDEDLSRKHYDYLLDALRKSNYQRYEISNFAKLGKESRHNKGYWNNEDYYAVGLGACGKIAGISYQNTKNINEYIQGNYRLSSEKLTDKEEMENYLMLRLRTAEGIEKVQFQKKYHQSFENMFPKSYNMFISNLIIDEHNCIKCSDEGIMLLDYILVNLFKEMEEC